jgi:hypothetical protein
MAVVAIFGGISGTDLIAISRNTIANTNRLAQIRNLPEAVARMNGALQ